MLTLKRICAAILALVVLASLAANVGGLIVASRYGLLQKIANEQIRPVLPAPEKIVVTYVQNGNQEVVFAGKDAENLHTVYGLVPTGSGYEMLCHDPGFILRFERNGEAYHTVSICYHCCNYGIDDDYIGFDASSSYAKFMLKVLTDKAPAPAAGH